MLWQCLDRSGIRSDGMREYNVIVGGANSAGRYDHVVISAHPSHSLVYLFLIIRNYFNPFQLDAQLKAVFRCQSANDVIGVRPKCAEFVSIVFEERTSSPMMTQPAVVIVRPDRDAMLWIEEKGAGRNGRRWRRIRVSR
jgi:hypothetical protein